MKQSPVDIRDVFTSSNLSNRMGEPANIVDVVANCAAQIAQIAEAITPTAQPGHDATGGTVMSLTEAVMGITAGLMSVAESIKELADAIRERE